MGSGLLPVGSDPIHSTVDQKFVSQKSQEFVDDLAQTRGFWNIVELTQELSLSVDPFMKEYEEHRGYKVSEVECRYARNLYRKTATRILFENQDNKFTDFTDWNQKLTDCVVNGLADNGEALQSLIVKAQNAWLAAFNRARPYVKIGHIAFSTMEAMEKDSFQVIETAVCKKFDHLKPKNGIRV